MNISRSLLRGFWSCLSIVLVAATATPALAAQLCLSGQSIASTDPTYHRVLSRETGSGIPSPTCGLSLTATAVRYDVHVFDISGCAVFPTQVIVSTCGGEVVGSGCSNTGFTDSVLTLYRSVPLATDGGGPDPFAPAAACSNALALNDNLTAPTTSSNGSSCDQANTADCHPGCAFSVLSGMKRTVGSGQFTVVVAGGSNTVVGNYNLFVRAAAAGCVVTAVDTAPVAQAITPPAFDEDTASSITLSYSDAEGHPATACAVANLDEVRVTTPCACNAGVCTVGVIGAGNYDGPASFDYTVTANALTSASATATLTITAVNDTPIITSNAPTSTNVGATYAYDPTWFDDGPGRIWTLTAAHTCGGTIDVSLGRVRFTPAVPPPPTCVVSIRICDQATPNLCASQDTQVTINSENLPPQINSNAPTTISENQEYVYDATSTDPDGNGLTWSLTPSHTCGGTIAPLVGVVEFIAPASSALTPSCVVDIRVCDGGSPTQCDTQATTVTILAVNDRPTLDAIPDPAAIQDTAGVQTVNLAGIGPGAGDPPQVLTVTAQSSNVASIPDPTVTYTSANATASLTYAPIRGAPGSAVISVVVRDDGGIANGGVNAFGRSFTQVVLGDSVFRSGFE